MTSNNTTELCRAMVAACRRLGVVEFCLGAGSRNSPLIRQLAAQPEFKIWHFFEERDAAFFALGRCRSTGKAVAVVTTSGTAAVELFPAVVEAHYQGMPLLCITADRPQSFRFSGAPQAINQHALFGQYPQQFADVACLDDFSALVATASGPLHWNLCLAEPVAGETYAALPAELPAQLANSAAKPSVCLTRPDLVLLGELLPAEQEFCKTLLLEIPGTPVWAEAASGLRCWLQENGYPLLLSGDSALRHYTGHDILRLGGVPSCRLWRDLESTTAIRVQSIARTGHPGLARASQHWKFAEIGHASFQSAPAKAWSPPALKAAGAVAVNFPASEPALLLALAKRIPGTAGLFVGNSLAIRTWNLVVPPCPVEHQLHVLRGANGIDGNLSFALGTLAGYAEAWILVGDLTALYNLAAPWVLGQMDHQNIRFVVMNNGGGKLFRRLPSLRDANDRERAFIENEHNVRLAGWAEMWGMGYHFIQTATDLPAVLPHGPVVLEIVPDDEASEAFWAAWAS